MPRPCSLCVHPDRKAIDDMLLEGGLPHRRVAERFHVSAKATWRHASKHLPGILSMGHGARMTARADYLLRKLDDLERLQKGLHGRAVEAKDLRSAIAAGRELARLLEFRLKMAGEIKDHSGGTTTVLNFNLTPERIREIAARVLDVHALPPAPEEEEDAIEAGPED